MLEYHRFKAVNVLFMKGRDEEARLELAALQRRYIALCDENSTLKMQMQEYEDILYLARNLIFDGEFYWLITGNIKQGPFCPVCYDRDGVLMRLSGDRSDRFCTACRKSFKKEAPPVDMAAAVPYEFEEERVLLPVETTPRKAKIIPFGK